MEFCTKCGGLIWTNKPHVCHPRYTVGPVGDPDLTWTIYAVDVDHAAEICSKLIDMSRGDHPIARDGDIQLSMTDVATGETVKRWVHAEIVTQYTVSEG